MSDGASWLFQVSSHQKAQAWTQGLNYWAALHSKEPLPGGVTNVEYGWGKMGGVPLVCWDPPASCAISSGLSKHDQLLAIDRYLDRLAHQVQQHKDLRTSVEKRVSIKGESKTSDNSSPLKRSIRRENTTGCKPWRTGNRKCSIFFLKKSSFKLIMMLCLPICKRSYPWLYSIEHF